MNWLLRASQVWVLFLFCLLSACRPDTTTSADPQLSANVLDGQQVAQISGQGDRRSLSDSIIWILSSQIDSSVIVGLKEVGTARGMVRGRIAISQQRWKLALSAVRQEREVKILAIDSLRYPVVRIKLGSRGALARLRQLPFVDYVEPTYFRISLASGDGCESGSSGGDSQFSDPTLLLPSGDLVASTYDADGMNVPNGWKLATGQGVKVGMVDTGLGWGDGEFGSGFSSGPIPRTLEVVQDGYPSCSHGTRIASLAVGPMNGTRSVGVAYGASLISVGQGNAVTSPNGFISGVAVDTAASTGAGVVIMAFGFVPGTNFSEFLSDVIDYHHYERDVVFVGAAGTCPIGGNCPQINTAVFPASKEEVLAVSGANSDGSRPSNMYDYGSKSGVVAYTALATVGLVPGLLSINGSSASTGFIGGVAALVRHRFPSFSARQVMDQIMKTSTGAQCGGAPSWRMAMVNVSAAVGGPCVSQLKGLLVHYTNTINSQDYYPFVRASAVINSPPAGFGGSGSYAAQWVGKPEQIVTNAVEGAISDGSGNTYWQSRRSIRFLPAFDNMPYRSTVEMSVLDQVLGTDDPRKMSVLVCSSPQQCYPTERGYPGDPPPPPPMSATISGATEVPPNSSCNYFAGAANGVEPYAYEWYVNSMLQSTGSSLSLGTPASGAVTILLKVTDAASGIAFVPQEISVVSGATCFDQRPGR